MFGATDCPYLFSCLLCLSSTLRLQLHHHIVLYWDHKWSFHLHPICYYLPLLTIGYHRFFLYVVSQITLLKAPLFELAVYKFLIRLLFMFMSPWKVSEPLSMLFAMVLTFVFITGICCTWWIPKINNVSTVHMPSTCHYLSSIQLWNSWKVCRITTTRWPLWPSITFIRFRSLCSSVPFITISTSNTTVNFITLGTLRTSISGPWDPAPPLPRGLWAQVSPWSPVSPRALCAPVSPFRPLSPLSLLGPVLPWSSFSLGCLAGPSTPSSCIYLDMISSKYTDYKILFYEFLL